ncbi:MAG: hypothetical protein J0H43_14245 [Actinobacteria bacterium]|nr:hypothetical protein [Actinomycetota bacterium]
MYEAGVGRMTPADREKLEQERLTFDRRAVGWSAVSSGVWLVLSLWAIFTIWGQLERLQVGSTATGTRPSQTVLHLLWWHTTGSLDVGLLWLALAFGTLAGAAHCLYVLTGSVPKRDFKIARLGWFLPQPLLGGVLGLLSFVVVRAGLVSASSGSTSLSIFGVAAVAAGAGLSAPAAYARLLKIGTTTKSQTGTPPEPKITSITPSPVSRTAPPEALTVVGVGLEGLTYTINGKACTATGAEDTSATLPLAGIDLSPGRLTVSAVKGSKQVCSRYVTVVV